MALLRNDYQNARYYVKRIKEYTAKQFQTKALEVSNNRQHFILKELQIALQAVENAEDCLYGAYDRGEQMTPLNPTQKQSTTETKTVYAAFRSYPDYSAPPPTLVSLHQSFEGAWKALDPEKRYPFTKSDYDINAWNGPEGHGLIKLLEVKE